ncbi:hypothetical protein TNCV_825091 [Trichonephila clavipes]|nr:hypothetical protein TNCV_825091 [Trichonephila clavipes]
MLHSLTSEMQRQVIAPGIVRSCGHIFEHPMRVIFLTRHDPTRERPHSAQWMTVDDSLFLGTWTDKQSSIPYHDVCDAGLDFVGFFSLRSDMSAIWLW